MKKISGRGGLILIIGTILLLFIGSGSFYAYWNTAPAEKTCASCHEINSSVNMFAQSAHRVLACKECHGTAMSNGFHSLTEKGMMVVNHFKTEETKNIRLDEDQILEVMDNCIRCHNSEYARWRSGGHSARYSDIFLNEKHNSTEQLNSDCLRCHGMFSGKNIEGIVAPIETSGPWMLNEGVVAENPVIPCLACHSVHTESLPLVQAKYENPQELFYQRDLPVPKVSFYNRQDKSKILAEDLPVPKMWEGIRQIQVSDDPYMRNCIQCHAPNAWHQVGTGDDRTPTGVHEGLSCLACHDNHSNDARKSCSMCHPAISNCNLDVTKMNTSYADPKSVNNIHSVACKSCHPNEKKEIKKQPTN